jgi:phage-related minor tail protein
MSDSTNTPSPEASARRYRTRGQTARDHRLTPRFTDEELSAIRAAAGAAQMTLTGFCALAALSVARRLPDEASSSREMSGVTAEELAEMQRELFAARVAVNRAGTNLNQAVAQLNATGQPVWLAHAVTRVAKALDEVDAVASRIHHRLA